jgi:peptidoglycan/LPS O-acetylase OafA/YrhL
MSGSVVSTETTARNDGRIVALDGPRGLMTILVLISHFFAEIANGIPSLGFGWYAVNMFFVLSGFLIGRLIIEKKDHANFFSVFIMRRVCRTIPSYVVSVLMIFGLLWLFRAEPWTQFRTEFPLWSYLTFTQNIFMAVTNDAGAYWLAPTWTLALEEQLYILLPLVFFLLPRRLWLPTFLGVAAVAVILRVLVFGAGLANTNWGLVVLPTRGDVLVIGVIAAILYKAHSAGLARYDLMLRALPIALLAATAITGLVDPVERRLFHIVGPLFVSAAFASFLLAVARGAPEGRRFEGPFLCFFGHVSYCVYLTHLAVLGLMHGLVFGLKPSLGSAEQWALTITALFVAVFVGWAMTRFMEERLTNYGRSWKWSAEMRGRPAGGAATASG